MIKHFRKITGTGKFLNFHSTTLDNNLKDFGKINLLYGENGSGKTTLTQILRSLKGDNNLLLHKRSFDHSFPQEILIITNHLQNSDYEFLEGKWNQYLPEIEIFDIHFINDNIHTGLEIQNTHKKNLFEIILGQQGVRLKNEIAILKERIRNGNKIIRETGRNIESQIGQAFTVEEYCRLEVDPEIDEKIKWKQQEIEVAENANAIHEKTKLVNLPLLKLPFDVAEVMAVLQQSIDHISDDFLQQFNTHKNHLEMKGREEEWIQQGVKSMDDTCPFCTRPFDASTTIIDAYRQYFNEEYKILLGKISKLEGAAESFNLEAILLDVENKISSNLLLIDFWKSYVTAPIDLKSILPKKEKLLDFFQKVKITITEKSKNPIHVHKVEEVQMVDNELVMVNEILSSYNQQIQNFNEGIEIVQSAETPQLPKLQQELQQLFAIQKRNLPEIVEFCNNVITYTKGIARLKETMQSKQSELDIFKQTIFASFGQKANDFLKIFAPYLQLKNLDSGYIGSSTDPTVKFGLYVNGNVLNQKKDAVESTIKYSLSEGDKSALALSFFMAGLDLDQDLENKIIVIDDPISSFDEKRKTAMLEELLKMGQRAGQLFLLTHDKNLANDFIKKTKNENLQLNCYQIGFDGKTGLMTNLNI